VIRTLFETPSAYRPSDAATAAPVPPVQAVLFDFSNTIFQMIDLETWLRRVGAAAGRLTVLDQPGAVAEISDQLPGSAEDLPALQPCHGALDRGPGLGEGAVDGALSGSELPAGRSFEAGGDPEAGARVGAIGEDRDLVARRSGRSCGCGRRLDRGCGPAGRARSTALRQRSR
jgi:hypothetical protein